MTTVFALSNLAVMPLWLLMILVPGWSVTGRVMRSPLSLVPLALVYAALVVPRVGTLWPLLNPPTLAGIMGLLATPEGTTIVWLHILAFDLFVGRWIYLDSQERSLSAWWTSPLLFLTLAFGPCGLLGYLTVRTFTNRPSAAADSQEWSRC